MQPIHPKEHLIASYGQYVKVCIQLNPLAFESDSIVLGFVTEIRREGRRNFRDQRTDVHKELFIVLVD